MTFNDAKTILNKFSPRQSQPTKGSTQIVLDLIYKHGIFKVFSIYENNLSANEIIAHRELVFEIAKENKDDSLLSWLSQSMSSTKIKEYDLILVENKIACLHTYVLTLKTLYVNNQSKKPEFDIVVLDGLNNLNQLHELCDLINGNMG